MDFTFQVTSQTIMSNPIDTKMIRMDRAIANRIALASFTKSKNAENSYIGGRTIYGKEGVFHKPSFHATQEGMFTTGHGIEPYEGMWEKDGDKNIRLPNRPNFQDLNKDRVFNQRVTLCLRSDHLVAQKVEDIEQELYLQAVAAVKTSAKKTSKNSKLRYIGDSNVMKSFSLGTTKTTIFGSHSDPDARAFSTYGDYPIDGSFEIESLTIAPSFVMMKPNGKDWVFSVSWVVTQIELGAPHEKKAELTAEELEAKVKKERKAAYEAMMDEDPDVMTDDGEEGEPMVADEPSNPFQQHSGAKRPLGGSPFQTPEAPVKKQKS